MWAAPVLAVLAMLALRARAQDVTVLQLQLPYDAEHTLQLNASIEYILDFVPNYPVSDEIGRVLWARSEGGDPARPLLLTTRQRQGAETWQLPYELQGRRLGELERTLCPGAGGAVGGGRGAYSLHVSTASEAAVAVRVRVSLAPAWSLDAASSLVVSASQVGARVLVYRFASELERVRVRVASDSDLCATLSVQNYSCPVAQSVQEIEASSEPRLTMMRSGALTLQRQQYPLGFYVVLVVHVSDEQCAPAAANSGPQRAERLWEDALAGGQVPRNATPPVFVDLRKKYFTVVVESSISRSQYVAAALSTLAVFGAFYVLFGALVLAQRWPLFYRYVKPKAVLANTSHIDAEGVRDAASTDDSVPRGSTADTFDRSSDSDSGEEEGAARAARGRGLALPAQLRLAALARRRERTLRARSDRYLHSLYTVAVFYALPVVQFVIAFQVVMNVSGSLDICYYNFLCAHPAGALTDFNHVFSNLGYLLLGALFMLQVRRRRARRRAQPRDEEYGIPAHYGLLSALGAGMMVVALLSASYHVCPNRLNFQFDTAFMYVLAVLSMVKIYQARHPDVNARAHATFGVLALVIALVVWGVLGGGALFWGLFTLLHIFTFLLLSLRIYYLGQLRFEREALAAAASEVRRSLRPRYGARLVLLVLANALNWAFAIYGLLRHSGDFASHVLQVLLGNTLGYMVFYLVMKVVHGERVRWYAWALLAGAAGTWAPALYLFVSGSTDWSGTPAASRHLNHECKVLQFYDAHDLWHMLSAAALYLSFSTMLTWDDGLSAVKRTDIAVF